ncbi:MAG: 3-phosphoglycerate dehydrogenase [Clostridia bacterium]|nr:3-phosphoglycerate dehydrogenase [Clostridia bacterium]
MFRIKTLNSISPVYQQCLSDHDYEVSSTVENPDAIIVRSADMHNMELPSSLKAIARAGAGYNNIPVDKCAEKGIVVFNTPGANANAVKELAVAALLLGSRNIAGGIEWARTLKDAGDDVPQLIEKGKKKFTGPELRGKTLGVIGLGEVGALFANAGKGLDMHVLGFDPFISVEHAWMLSRSIEHVTNQMELLTRADYVSIHIPLTDKTKGMFSEEVISHMKRGAVLLNLSRGELVDDDAVLDALEEGHLRAYVTDFPNARLLDRKGVVAIPHLGASTPESEDNCVVMASREINAYLKHGIIRNSVNYPNCELDPVSGHRLALMHQNVPNMVTTLTGIVSKRHINISSMVNKSRGRYAYTVLELDGEQKEMKEIAAEAEALDMVYGVRFW